MRMNEKIDVFLGMHLFLALLSIFEYTSKDGYHKKKWLPMGKNIANMYRYAQVALATNMRYINHLSVIYEKVTPVEMIKNISSSIIINERRYSGFNILKEETIRLLEILSSGSYIIKGFTNRDLRNKL